mmetsp:Transcript_20372/g.38124  ORF Transcript_20372/g.38124 Transcript_20372/m.38124 type:complete len:256 (+) Transcript_20372:376-1143(+)
MSTVEEALFMLLSVAKRTLQTILSSSTVSIHSPRALSAVLNHSRSRVCAQIRLASSLTSVIVHHHRVWRMLLTSLLLLPFPVKYLQVAPSFKITPFPLASLSQVSFTICSLAFDTHSLSLKASSIVTMDSRRAVIVEIWRMVCNLLLSSSFTEASGTELLKRGSLLGMELIVGCLTLRLSLALSWLLKTWEEYSFSFPIALFTSLHFLSVSRTGVIVFDIAVSVTCVPLATRKLSTLATLDGIELMCHSVSELEL